MEHRVFHLGEVGALPLVVRRPSGKSGGAFGRRRASPIEKAGEISRSYIAFLQNCRIFVGTNK
ncbi:hypothetical protein HMPREF1556_01479 [Porphyromonas sp. oral taxon 278 str. W7784]|nr:hypothetical protein HMPREF1556_01479 [Porphyromonas sp. oral taxon 278 str. W7784]